MPSWLVSIVKFIGSLLVPEIVKQIAEVIRDWFVDQRIKRQKKKNKKAAEKYEADKSKANADDFIDGL